MLLQCCRNVAFSWSSSVVLHVTAQRVLLTCVLWCPGCCIQLAGVCEGYSGADIEALVREAALCALEEDMGCDEVGPGRVKDML